MKSTRTLIATADGRQLDYLQSHELLDDGYDITHAGPDKSPFPQELITSVSVMLMSEADFSTLRSRDTLPKPHVSRDFAELMSLVLQQRQADYATTLEEDEAILKSGIAGRALDALRVRMGEKTIIRHAVARLQGILLASSVQPRSRQSSHCAG